MKDLNLTKLKPMLRKYLAVLSLHAVFAATLVVLLCYLFVVWRISSLATAEPSDDQVLAAQTIIPKVDKKAVDQILKLEQNSSEVHSLFQEARNNPFQE